MVHIHFLRLPATFEFWGVFCFATSALVLERTIAHAYKIYIFYQYLITHNAHCPGLCNFPPCCLAWFRPCFWLVALFLHELQHFNVGDSVGLHSEAIDILRKDFLVLRWPWNSCLITDLRSVLLRLRCLELFAACWLPEMNIDLILNPMFFNGHRFYSPCLTGFGLDLVW